MGVESFAVVSPVLVQKGLVRRLGYASGKLPRDLKGPALVAVAWARLCARPVAAWKISPLEKVEKGEIRAKGFSLASAHWAALARKAGEDRKVLAFALTLGPLLDRSVAHARKTSMSMSYLLDAAGSEIIEATADRISRQWPRILGLPDQPFTRRFSPGYCDFALSGQAALFDFLDAGRLGISLVSGGALLPSKTLTAVQIAAKTLPRQAPCRDCAKANCRHRREKAAVRKKKPEKGLLEEALFGG